MSTVRRSERRLTSRKQSYSPPVFVQKKDTKGKSRSLRRRFPGSRISFLDYEGSSRTRQLKPDRLPSGKPFKCGMCKSSFIVNPVRVRYSRSSKRQPTPRYKVDPVTKETLTLCNACGLAFKNRKNTELTNVNTDKEGEKRFYIEEAKDFAKRLSQDLNDTSAERLWCPNFGRVPCCCIQNYILGISAGDMPPNKQEVMNRSKHLLSILKTAMLLKGEKCYNMQEVLKKAKRARNIGLGNGHRRSKRYENYIFENREYLRKNLRLCEKGVQQILLYSNNFLHRRLLTTPKRLSRVQTINGGVEKFLPIEKLHTQECCEENCVKLALTHQYLVKQWREKAQKGQKAAKRVVAEMLIPAAGSRCNCPKFISMVTGVTCGTVARTNVALRNSAGQLEPHEHGMTLYWRKVKAEKIQKEGPQSSTPQLPCVSSNHSATLYNTPTTAAAAVIENSIENPLQELVNLDLQRQELEQIQKKLDDQQQQIIKKQQEVQEKLVHNLVKQQLQQISDQNQVTAQYIHQQPETTPVAEAGIQVSSQMPEIAQQLPHMVLPKSTVTGQLKYIVPGCVLQSLPTGELQPFQSVIVPAAKPGLLDTVLVEPAFQVPVQQLRLPEQNVQVNYSKPAEVSITAPLRTSQSAKSASSISSHAEETETNAEGSIHSSIDEEERPMFTNKKSSMEKIVHQVQDLNEDIDVTGDESSDSPDEIPTNFFTQGRSSRASDSASHFIPTGRSSAMLLDLILAQHENQRGFVPIRGDVNSNSGTPYPFYNRATPLFQSDSALPRSQYDGGGVSPTNQVLTQLLQDSGVPAPLDFHFANILGSPVPFGRGFVNVTPTPPPIHKTVNHSTNFNASSQSSEQKHSNVNRTLLLDSGALNKSHQIARLPSDYIASDTHENALSETYDQIPRLLNERLVPLHSATNKNGASSANLRFINSAPPSVQASPLHLENLDGNSSSSEMSSSNVSLHESQQGNIVTTSSVYRSHDLQSIPQTSSHVSNFCPDNKLPTNPLSKLRLIKPKQNPGKEALSTMKAGSDTESELVNLSIKPKMISQQQTLTTIKCNAQPQPDGTLLVTIPVSALADSVNVNNVLKQSVVTTKP